MSLCDSYATFGAWPVLLRRRMPRHPPRAFLRSIPISNDSALVLPHEQLESTCFLGASSHSCMLDCFSFVAVISICRKPPWTCLRPGAPTGAKETRTPNIQLAKLALYQLSYNPSAMGLNGLEPLTPALSERCSNQLSYRPGLVKESEILKGGNPAAPSGTATLLRLSPSQRSCFRRQRRLRALPSPMA